MKSVIYLALILFNLPLLLTAQSNGIGHNASNSGPCLPESFREEIQLRIDENRIQLNLVPNPNLETNIPDDLIFPVSVVDSVPGFHHYYGTSNYVDQDNTNGLQDYQCLSKTYNGHKGSDFFTFPFAWYLYENDLVHAVSSFAGTIVFKQDGNNDTNCSPQGSWNAVYVQHADGTTMWYGHLKSGSLTTKSLGETVERGEYLGVIASSGFSTDAHLHIELYDQNNVLLDPFQGNCNDLNANSLWEVQPNHSTPSINAVLTHNVQPAIACGPPNETAGLSNIFYLNDNVYVGIYMTDYVAGTVAICNIYRPDGSLYQTFNTVSDQFSFQWFWNSRQYNLTETDPSGIWTIEATMGNETAEHSFEYINIIANSSELEKIDFSVYPNPTQDFISIKSDSFSNNMNFKLINCYGQSVKSGQLDSDIISMEELSTGLYYLVVENQDQTFPVKRILKY